MLVTVKYFGMAVEKTNTSQETINISSNLATIHELEELVLGKHPLLQSITYNIALNKEIKEKKQLLNNGDELAFLPPFAGG